MTTARVTWWGHATVEIEDSGRRVLTDPVLRDRLAHLRRRRGPTPAPAPPDAVLISHLHADHLDTVSLRQLPGEPTLVVPAGAAAFVRRALGPRHARRCVELAAGDSTDVGPVRVTAVPAAHPSGRAPWSRHRAAAVGYLVRGELTTWFAGDTGLFDGMSTLGRVDLALIPVGGWGPSLGDGHLDPAGAAEAMRRANPREAIPIHYGTFWPVGCARVRPDLFTAPGRTFARLAAQSAPTTLVRVLAPGDGVGVGRSRSAP
ncbi:MAG TPA: MBL fold metallo-hydrolase [Micromonosporaceae bacterium]|nr:MBL fold metallo-hydrolase [Micromonosporaceae bacterium]